MMATTRLEIVIRSVRKIYITTNLPTVVSGNIIQTSKSYKKYFVSFFYSASCMIPCYLLMWGSQKEENKAAKIAYFLKVEHPGVICWDCENMQLCQSISLCKNKWIFSSIKCKAPALHFGRCKRHKKFALSLFVDG